MVGKTEIQEKLATKGLKITPQRMAILDAIYNLEHHPTADKIIEYVRRQHPGIASGTVYKVLDTLVENKLLKRVTTDKDVMRYDGILDAHHHLYCTNCDRIHDYVSEDLNQILADFFKNRNIDGFHIQEFVLQIKGTFDKCT